MKKLRIDPRHREAMDGLGVYDAVWALAKKVAPSDVHPAHRRVLFFEKAVRGGPIPKLFPELAELGHAGIPVTILNTDGVEEVARILHLPSNGAYRVTGLGWIRFVEATGISRGDRIDVYTCRRGDGDDDDERCLFFFKSRAASPAVVPRNYGRERRRWPAAVNVAISRAASPAVVPRNNGHERRRWPAAVNVAVNGGHADRAYLGLILC